MKILAIETSCDETAIALIKANGNLNSPKFKIIKNLVSSQINIHRPFGGVVPNLAKREHLKNLPLLFKQIAKSKEQIDLLAVTVGPGLEPALWTGINFAKEIQKKYFPGVKIIGANHLEGHLYSFLLRQKTGISKSKLLITNYQFPSVALIVSGGHTILLKMDSLIKFKKLGETLDDAVGECFDKVARMLNLPYPGGPEIEKLARRGNPDAINFPRPMLHPPAGGQKNYNFSFSGLKTSVLYFLRDNPKIKKEDIGASFQKAAIDVLVQKTIRAAYEFNAKSIMVSGGVSANKALKKEFQIAIKKESPRPLRLAKQGRQAITNYQLLISKFSTDNAAMIAVAAYINFLHPPAGGKNRRLTANSNLNL